MGTVGLLYVGAVLFINGLMLLGHVEAKSAVPMNIFVGLLQVFTPTYLIVTADGDPAQILSASGLYLFGFTYLYVAANNTFDLDGAALGWFSGFVAVCALVFAGLNFFYSIDGVRFGDAAFGVIWLHWAFLWALFFVVLTQGRSELGSYTGMVAAVQGWITGAAPAFLLLVGQWSDHVTTWAIILAIAGVVIYGAGSRLATSLAARPSG